MPEFLVAYGSRVVVPVLGYPYGPILLEGACEGLWLPVGHCSVNLYVR